MARWAPDAALRLERAAMELFVEQGYAATTVPAIAARAGLTPRTFFRHFADKRDVLFLREREFPTVIAEVLAGAPGGLDPLSLAMYGLEHAASGDLASWRMQIAARRAVIRSDSHLRERELLKSAALADAVRDGLVTAGVQVRDATMVGLAASMLFDTAMDRWLSESADTTLLEALREQRALLGSIVGAAVTPSA